MRRERIVYQNWIVDMGKDPGKSWDEVLSNSNEYNYSIITAVNSALFTLKEEEVSFIRAFYMQGMRYREISKVTGRAIYRLEAVHNRALRKLKKLLPQLLDNVLPLPETNDEQCPLCNHQHFDSINKLIGAKTKSETWRRIMNELQEKFGIKISTPQRLIGHYKYHM